MAKESQNGSTNTAQECLGEVEIVVLSGSYEGDESFKISGKVRCFRPGCRVGYDVDGNILIAERTIPGPNRLVQFNGSSPNPDQWLNACPLRQRIQKS